MNKILTQREVPEQRLNEIEPRITAYDSTDSEYERENHRRELQTTCTELLDLCRKMLPKFHKADEKPENGARGACVVAIYRDGLFVDGIYQWDERDAIFANGRNYPLAESLGWMYLTDFFSLFKAWAGEGGV